jgi:hypothetical protein
MSCAAKGLLRKPEPRIGPPKGAASARPRLVLVKKLLRIRLLNFLDQMLPSPSVHCAAAPERQESIVILFPGAGRKRRLDDINAGRSPKEFF